MRKVIYWLFVLFLASAAFFLIREPVLTAIGEFLVVSDPLEKADAIEVLAGGEATRCAKAAELFSQGWAPRIVITKSNYPHAIEELKRYGIRQGEGYENCAAILAFLKVPKGALTILEGYNESTADEAQKLLKYMEQQHLKRLIVLTSNFHSRRSRLLFRRTLGARGITILVQAAPPNYDFDPAKWWTRRNDMKTLLWEYQKLVFYALSY
jgi:uncharacterized SAM-binding protein YcdF (DUF218 family)